MEAPSQIGEIINDTRHLDVHPGTMNYKHRVEESQKIHTDNLIMANRLVNIKPVYGYSDLHANRGMLADKQSSKVGAGTASSQVDAEGLFYRDLRFSCVDYQVVSVTRGEGEDAVAGEHPTLVH